VTDILGRIGSILRSNLDDTLDTVLDPGALVDRLFRDYTDVIGAAESTVGQTVGDLRETEDQIRQAEGEVDAWGSKAATAAQRGSQSAISGNASDAARFDGLARAALRQGLVHETRAGVLHELAARQTEDVHQLRTALEGMSAKLDELRAKGDELAARTSMADARRRVRASLASLDRPVLDGGPGSTEDRSGMDESPAADGAEIERRLAVLKGGSAAIAGAR